MHFLFPGKTSHHPSTEPPHCPLKRYLGHWDGGHRKATSRSVQSPQRRQREVINLIQYSSSVTRPSSQVPSIFSKNRRAGLKSGGAAVTAASCKNRVPARA